MTCDSHDMATAVMDGCSVPFWLDWFLQPSSLSETYKKNLLLPNAGKPLGLKTINYPGYSHRSGGGRGSEGGRRRRGEREREREREADPLFLTEGLRSHSTMRPSDLHIRRICRLRPGPHKVKPACASSGCQPSRMAKRRTARGVRALLESIRLRHRRFVDVGDACFCRKR